MVSPRLVSPFPSAPRALRRSSRLGRSLGAVLLVFVVIPDLRAEEPAEENIEWPGEESEWKGYRRHDFDFEDVRALVVSPRRAAPGRPWIWRARFFGHEPQADLALLERGYHLAYCDVSNLYGAPVAVERWSRFHALLTERHGLAKRVALEGMSRGGLIIYNFAASHPEKVACIYGDNPVCDFRSWPGGLGSGPGSPGDWKRCLEVHGLTPDAAQEFPGPIDRLEPMARARIPILHIVGAADEVVPVAENSARIETAYRALGGPIHVISKPGLGHHPHSLPNPRPIVSFVVGSCRAAGSDLSKAIEFEDTVRLRHPLMSSRERFLREKKGHVVFLGGSITEMNGYRPLVMRRLAQRFPETRFTFTNAGIASTCSTTGAFRLGEDVLAKGPVDLLLVEFAVNDDQDAVHAARESLRGMEGIVRHVRTQDPRADIVMIHFVNPGMLATIERGEVPLPVEQHERVAEHYGAATVHVAQEVTDRILAGTFSWKRYGGTHPGSEGNELVARMVESLLERAWSGSSEPPTGGTTTEDPAALHALPPPIDAGSYANGRFLDPALAEGKSGWRFGVPDWSSLPGSKRDRFLDVSLLAADESGAELSLAFRGPLIGAYVLAGPDAGRLEGSVDGVPFAPVELFHRFSRGLHYPRTVLFAADLESGDHTLVLKVSSETSSEGHAARILRFVVNDPES